MTPITKKPALDFLEYRDMPDPKSLSDAARELLTVSEKPTEFVTPL